MDFPFPTELGAFVVWIGTAGAGGVVVSLLLERLAIWKNWQNAGAKKALTLLLFLALPFVSLGLQAALGAADPALVAKVQEYLNLALAGLVAWGASQFAHAADPEAKK